MYLMLNLHYLFSLEYKYNFCDKNRVCAEKKALFSVCKLNKQSRKNSLECNDAIPSRYKFF